MRSFYAESRLLTNRKLKEELGVELLFPTYREGQAAQLEEERRLGIVPAAAPSTPVLASRPAAATTGSGRTVFLVDNGSVRAAATLSLRSLAASLQQRLGDGTTVVAASARWSDRVEPEELGGERAALLLPSLRSHVLDADGPQARHVIVSPLFVGPSATVSEFIPTQLRTVDAEFRARGGRSSELRLELAPSLVCLCPFIEQTLPPERRGEARLAEILQERVTEAVAGAGGGPCRPVVALVDHGTPSPAVNRVRGHVAEQLRARLVGDGGADASALEVVACSMERREGPEFAFNEPLLEDILSYPPVAATDPATTPLVLAMLFLQPGKHAGAGGDVDQLVEEAQRRWAEEGTGEARVARRVLKTGLLAPHPLLIDLLVRADRPSAHAIVLLC